MIRFSLFVKLLILLLPLTFNAMAYEEATYSTVYQNNIYEIRKYSDRLAIQVNYTNQNSGFRKLFNYISGSNIDSKKINMTIPLTQSNENGDMVMQFFLPSNFTKKDAPAPTNNKVKLVVIEEGYYAVLKYSGRLTNKNFDKNKKNLREKLLKDNIVILSSAINAIYNGPFTLPFLRRNEAIFRIDWKNK